MFCNGSRDFDVYHCVRQNICPVAYLLLYLCTSSSVIWGQTDTTLRQSLSIEGKDINLKQVLDLIGREAHVEFAYSPTLLATGHTFRFQIQDKPLEEILTSILADVGLGYRTTAKKIVLYRLKSALPKFSVGGYVYDNETGEHLIGAHIYDLESGVGTYSNEYGRFNLTLAMGEYQLIVSYIGYQDEIVAIDLDRSQSQSVRLKGHDPLATVVVLAQTGNHAPEPTGLSTASFSMEEIDAQPAIGGEVDVTRVLTLLPGVSNGIEGTSGIFVRGGTPDQNLILLDGVPVYNVSHLFGFLSVFNSDAIQKMYLIKGGFPARYSGRLSSVLDIRMKEGNMHRFGVSGSISPIASRISVEGPIIKDKMSFLLTGRRTFVDLFLGKIKRTEVNNDFTANGLKYFFSDYNAKWNYRMSDRDRIYISFYGGEDALRRSDEFGSRVGKTGNKTLVKNRIEWGNLVGAFRWNHLFGSNLFSNLTINYSRYQFGVYRLEDESRFNGEAWSLLSGKDVYYNSFVRSWSLNLDFDFAPSPGHYIKFGGRASAQNFLNGESGILLQDGPMSARTETLFNNDPKPANSFSLYIEDEVLISNRFSANLGQNTSMYHVEGRTYGAVEPRARLQYALTDHWTARAAYTRMTQYLHLISNTGVGLPNDLWISSTATISPQRSWQLSSGLGLLSDGWDISFDGYYKKMKQLVTFGDETTNLVSPQSIEEQVVTGWGRSIGLEFKLKKQKGKTNSWLSYTLAWTNRFFPQIGNGQPFPYKYDRRHDLSVNLTHKLSPKFEFTASWVFQNGIAVSLPSQEFEVARSINTDGSVNNVQYFAVEYRSRNNFRFPFYHRLDLGLAYYMKAKWGKHSLHLSVYNAYDRKNPFSISPGLFARDNGKTLVFGYQKNSLLPILPGIAYRFNISEL